MHEDYMQHSAIKKTISCWVKSPRFTLVSRFYHRRGVRLVEKETCPTDMQHMHLYLFWGV